VSVLCGLRRVHCASAEQQARHVEHVLRLPLGHGVNQEARVPRADRIDKLAVVGPGRGCRKLGDGLVQLVQPRHSLLVVQDAIGPCE
jgi:hypothetical protein